MQCQATTKNGLPCRLKAIDGEDFCHIHMPKFCKYCGTEMEGEYCHECGGSDEIEPDFEKPDELPVKSNKTRYTNAPVWLADHMNGETAKSVKPIVEELCDQCGKWFKESDLKDGLCKNCNPPPQFITSLSHTEAGIVTVNKLHPANYASKPVSNYISCKKCHKIIGKYAVDKKGYCNSCHIFRDSEEYVNSVCIAFVVFFGLAAAILLAMI